MEQVIEFETPENVKVRYELAGLGSRFLAWFADQLILLILMFVLFVILAIADVDAARWFERLGQRGARGEDASLYIVGIAAMAIGLASFLYFALFELLMRGQTLGKRNVSIRVVKTNGFALDANSILLRSVFRIIDNIPLVWVVPFFSRYHQRLGDMVAGTVVVVDQPKQLGTLRDVLLERAPADRVFRISSTALKELRPVDIEAAEKLLERWNSLAAEQREPLARIISEGLAARLKIPAPPPGQDQQFLEDLMAAEYQRRHSQLG
jgi:uncharacterized RDD family membrane protein YckC